MNLFVYLCANVIIINHFNFTDMWEKLSTYTLDVSKYILTGVVIASMFKEFADKTVMYIVGIIAAILFLVAGLIFYQKSDKEKSNKNNKKGRK